MLHALIGSWACYAFKQSRSVQNLMTEVTNDLFQLRNPVKVITRSTLKVIIDSTVSDHLPERSDAGVGL